MTLSHYEASRAAAPRFWASISDRTLVLSSVDRRLGQKY